MAVSDSVEWQSRQAPRGAPQRRPSPPPPPAASASAAAAAGPARASLRRQARSQRRTSRADADTNAYAALGVFGAARPERIGIFHPSSRTMAPVSS